MVNFIRNTIFWSNLSIAKQFWKRNSLCYFTNYNFDQIKDEIKQIHLFYFRKFCFLKVFFQSNRRCILEEFTHKNNYVEFFSIIKRIKQKDKIAVFDVGGNVGWFSLFLSLFLKGNIKFHVFEPLRENLYLLKKNLSKNNIKAKIFPVALSNKKKKTDVFVFTSSGATINKLQSKILKRIYKNHGRLKDTYAEKTLTTSLDILFKEKKISGADVIKIDAEGEEENIINGSKKIISLFNPIILCAYEHYSNDKKRIISLVKSINPNYKLSESKNGNKILCFYQEKEIGYK